MYSIFTCNLLVDKTHKKQRRQCKDIKTNLSKLLCLRSFCVLHPVSLTWSFIGRELQLQGACDGSQQVWSSFFLFYFLANKDKFAQFEEKMSLHRVGKTAIISQFLYDQFCPEYKPTVITLSDRFEQNLSYHDCAFEKNTFQSPLCAHKYFVIPRSKCQTQKYSQKGYCRRYVFSM